MLPRVPAAKREFERAGRAISQEQRGRRIKTAGKAQRGTIERERRKRKRQREKRQREREREKR